MRHLDEHFSPQWEVTNGEKVEGIRDANNSTLLVPPSSVKAIFPDWFCSRDETDSESFGPYATKRLL